MIYEHKGCLRTITLRFQYQQRNITLAKPEIPKIESVDIREIDDNLIMTNPFEEPYEYFFRRQKEAFGRETEAIS